MNSMQGATGYNQSKGPYSGQKVGGNKIRQVPNFTPEQMQLYGDLYQHVGPQSYLSRLAGGDQSLFGEIEAPALQQLGQFQSGLSNRFSLGGGGPGAMSARHGSGHNIAQGQLASDFAMQLQAQRQNLQRQAIMDLQNLSSNLLDKRPYETYLEPRQQKQSWWQQALPFATGTIGGIVGGPAGAFTGYQLGNTAKQGFTGGGQSGVDLSQYKNLGNDWGNFFINNFPGGV